ncbi:MAG: NAD-dependent epimerase/dehydratase family protein [Bacteriovoracaceae bacterium]
MKRILVFGSTGFIGSEFTSHIKSLGHEVVALGRTASTSIDFHHPETWESLIKDGDYIAFFITPSAGEEDHHFKAIERMFKICSEKKIAHFLYLSSGGAIYGRGEKAWKESDQTNPNSPYGLFKKKVEELLLSQSFSVSIARPSNIYGEKQSPHKRFGAVTTFFHQIENGITLNIYGTLDISKDFLHVEDLVEALSILLLQKKSGVFNLGTGKNHSLKEIISEMEKVTGKKAEMIFFPMAITDIPYYRLDCTKAENVLEWKAKIHLEEGILRYKDKK